MYWAPRRAATAAEVELKATGLERTLADVARTGVEQAAGLERKTADLLQQLDALKTGVQGQAVELRALARSSQSAHARLDAIHPPPLDPTMMVAGEPLAPLARERGGIAPGVALGTLSADARYALFETVFYDTRAVAAKQRVYIDYVDRELASQAPFVDLGCGRGEFLHILRELLGSRSQIAT